VTRLTVLSKLSVRVMLNPYMLPPTSCRNLSVDT
jgi:hypothetical protein